MSIKKITITSGNEIMRTMYVEQEYVSIQAGAGEVIHDGHYPKNLYDYNETTEEFTHKATVETPRLLATSERHILSVIIKQLEQQGLSLPLNDELMTTKDAAKRLIDLAAGSAKTRIVSKGIYITDEYRIVFDQVKVWRAAGSPSNDLPRAISDDWIIEKGITPEQAAVEIEQSGQGFIDALLDLRNLRLKGKAAVDNATVETFKATAQTYIDQINQI